jgi:hypothetical protein
MDGVQAYFIGRIFGVITDPIALVTAFILILLFYKLIKKNFVLILAPTLLTIYIKVNVSEYLNSDYFFVHLAAYGYLILTTAMFFILRWLFNRKKNGNY